MKSDIRSPIGWLFSTLGLLLVAYGLAVSEASAGATLVSGSAINVYWGLAMGAFGAAMLTATRKARRRAESAARSCEPDLR